MGYFNVLSPLIQFFSILKNYISFWVARWRIFKWPQVGDFGWPSGGKDHA